MKNSIYKHITSTILLALAFYLFFSLLVVMNNIALPFFTFPGEILFTTFSYLSFYLPIYFILVTLILLSPGLHRLSLKLLSFIIFPVITFGIVLEYSLSNTKNILYTMFENTISVETGNLFLILAGIAEVILILLLLKKDFNSIIDTDQSDSAVSPKVKRTDIIESQHNEPENPIFPNLSEAPKAIIRDNETSNINNSEKTETLNTYDANRSPLHSLEPEVELKSEDNDNSKNKDISEIRISRNKTGTLQVINSSKDPNKSQSDNLDVEELPVIDHDDVLFSDESLLELYPDEEEEFDTFNDSKTNNLVNENSEKSFREETFVKDFSPSKKVDQVIEIAESELPPVPKNSFASRVNSIIDIEDEDDYENPVEEKIEAAYSTEENQSILSEEEEDLLSDSYTISPEDELSELSKYDDIGDQIVSNDELSELSIDETVNEIEIDDDFDLPDFPEEPQREKSTEEIVSKPQENSDLEESEEDIDDQEDDDDPEEDEDVIDALNLPEETIRPLTKLNAHYEVPKKLLDDYPDGDYWVIGPEEKRAAETLTETLKEFDISAEVTGIRKGPVVTMFEILPAPGVKLSKITNLSDNIALRLAASSVRIVAPIPGKHAVGIEVPNKKRSKVSFKEMLNSPKNDGHKAAIPVILGKDITGNDHVVDLVQMPHLLIAGATGSGKSVCVNSLICSVLYNRSPEDVRLILIDPKIVELKLYNNIPHLLTPVITDAKKAFEALQYCIYEMERRYALLDALAVRDIRSFNKKIKREKLTVFPLPYIVVVIDEFADLMATTKKELESTLSRLAAMSRAVGIHLVLATQRPSTDVITGLIKANIPSRIAFKVSSKVDSRIILDMVGADKLLGQGDMLYTSATNPVASRIQGSFLSEDEVNRVVEHVKTLGEPEYIDDEIFIDDEDDDTTVMNLDSEDPLMNKAIEIIATAKKASASYLQRRLKIGYNRAARIIEDLESRGIVGPANGSKPREVLSIPDAILENGFSS